VNAGPDETKNPAMEKSSAWWIRKRYFT